MAEIWEKGLPGTANSPKSGYRTAAEGKPLQRRRNLSMIVMDLKAIWEMSVKRCDVPPAFPNRSPVKNLDTVYFQSLPVVLK